MNMWNKSNFFWLLKDVQLKSKKSLNLYTIIIWSIFTKFIKKLFDHVTDSRVLYKLNKAPGHKAREMGECEESDFELTIVVMNQRELVLILSKYLTIYHA